MNRSGNGMFQYGSKVHNEINIRELIIKYLRYWYFFIVGIGLTFTVAFLHIRYNTTPLYSTKSTVLIKGDGNEQLSFSGQIASKNIGNEMIILKSRHLMERVLSELGLNTSFYVEERFKKVEIFKDDLPITLIVGKLEPSAFGKTIKIKLINNNNFALVDYNAKGEEVVTNHKYGHEIVSSFATFTVLRNFLFVSTENIFVKFHNVKNLANHYSQSLSIKKESEDSNVLRLSIIDPVPKKSMLILNKLIEVFNKETIEDKNEVQLSTIEFLDERIKFLSTELAGVEKDVEQYKQQYNLTNVETNASLYVSSANIYNRELEALELNIEILNSLEDYLNQEDLKLVPGSMNIQDPTLNSLTIKFNELHMERQRMLRSIQPSSSLIRDIDDQLASLRINIIENLKNIKNGMVLTRNNLKSNTAQFNSKIRQVPSMERELLEINRQQGVKQSIYLFLLQKREEMGLALASNVSNSRLIDPATEEGSLVSPNKTSIYLGAIILGFLIPFAFIYTKEILNDKVIDKEEVEKIGIPVLGEIFHSSTKGGLQIIEGSHSIIAETFRLVRANIFFATMDKKRKVIMVTSSRSGEGKTFISINLAASLALSGKKVIILDFDLRKPSLGKDLGLTKRMGVNDYLNSDNLPLESVIEENSKVSGLFAISAGNLPFNPAESMMSPRVSILMDQLRANYDYIVVDTSPLGLVADAYTLAPYINSTLYVVRYNYSYKSQLDIIADIYHNHKLSQPMIVLNDAKKKNGHSYRYGYGYGNENENGRGKDAKKRIRKEVRT